MTAEEGRKTAAVVDERRKIAAVAEEGRKTAAVVEEGRKTAAVTAEEQKGIVEERSKKVQQHKKACFQSNSQPLD